MIIVKTNNGDRFINNDKTIQVIHNKEKATVEVYPAEWIGRNPPHPLYYLIENVESVTYVSDVQAVNYKDEGSEIERLKARCDELSEKNYMMRQRLIDIGEL